MSYPYGSNLYNATVDRVVDGDTVNLTVDLGFTVLIRQSCRLYGINAAEKGTEGGNAATANLTELLPVGTHVVVQSLAIDKFGGRFDGIIYLTGTNLNDKLVKDGWAAAWDGKGPRPVPPWPR